MSVTDFPGTVQAVRWINQDDGSVVNLGSEGATYDATATLKAIMVPTLVVAGDRDPVCKPEASQRMHREIAGSQLALLKSAKHMGLIEHHNDFAGHVSHFALGCLSPGSLSS